ncbi:PHP domain-containing protein [Treponema primitia]|uniref:PHP domain-containing protein n=1 Tax=Treponema primitia TaxID=88058 RepID=UPI00397FD6CF
MIDYRDIINDPRSDPQKRLDALKKLEKPAVPEIKNGEVNNHIHTIYSFSPYTPSMAALKSKEAGLAAAGSVDHDSIGAAEEMIAACGILGIGGCTGFEVRVSFKTGADGKPGPFADRKLNNPDSIGAAYMTVQGIPAPAIPKVRDFLDPIRKERLLRTRKMTESANGILHEAGLPEIDFQRDVIDKSMYNQGGGLTERHLLAALAEKFIEKYGKGPEINEKLALHFGINPPDKLRKALSDPANPHYLYDLLGILKSGFLSRIFIQPGDNECICAKTVTAFADSIRAIPAYAYLGDIGESPTGDKKAEKFEDDYTEELFDELSRLGYRAVTYMPPRNSPEQLRRVQRLCAERGFMEISGVDINSSRQSFNCPEVLQDEFRHLLNTTWALIAHERLASVDPAFGLFSPDNPLGSISLQKRLSVYASAGKELDPKNPGVSIPGIIKKLQEGRYQI